MAVKEYSYAKQGQLRLSTHFRVHEFASKDGNYLYSDTVLIDDALVAKLEELYQRLCDIGYDVKYININSGYRTRQHDIDAGGNGSGQHTLGKAADFDVQVSSRKPYVIDRSGTYYIDAQYLCSVMQDLGWKGIGYIGGKAVHGDTRTGKWWGNEVTGASISDFYTAFSVPKVDTALMVKGDIDGSGVVDTTDARLALDYAVGKITLTDWQVIRGDVNNDGKMDTTDARLILEMAVA